MQREELLSGQKEDMMFVGEGGMRVLHLQRVDPGGSN